MPTDVTQIALYVNHRGQPVTHSSYSARQTFKHCPREFELTRIQGWSDKSQRAAPMFGKCVESGVQFYEESNRRNGTGVERFVQMWQEVAALPNFKELQFTDSEGDWESLLRAGKEMMRLYEVRAPYLPISTNPRVLFQQVLRKKLFPGTEYDKLENKAIFDMLSFPRWNHPMLPKLEHKEGCEFQAKSAEMEQIDCTCGLAASRRDLIVDIKTTGDDLDMDLISLDPQLAEYAWQARIADVGFLWFVKRGHGLKKGSRVTLLEDAVTGTAIFWRAGFELVVLTCGELDNAYVGTYAALTAFEAALKGLRGKARDVAETAHLKAAMDAGTVAFVPQSTLTRQRLQFGAARFTQQDMDEIGKDVAQTTAEMLRANKDGYYPKLSGIRFPNEKCNYCAMRWICLNKPEQRDEKLTRRGEEWLDGKYTED